MISTLKVNFVTLMETCTGSAGIRALLGLGLLNYNACQAAPAQFKALSEAVEALYIIWESIKILVLDSSSEIGIGAQTCGCVHDRVMGGPNLEVFKFGLYLFVPIFALLHFGDPDWYHNNVLPVRVDLEHISICVEEYPSTNRNCSHPERKLAK